MPNIILATCVICHQPITDQQTGEFIDPYKHQGFAHSTCVADMLLKHKKEYFDRTNIPTEQQDQNHE